MPIYDSYEDEPEDIFQPLSETLYSKFYELEMAEFADDLPFYHHHLPKESHFLELGCGNGRIGSRLTAHNRNLTGIDISHAMLLKAKAKSSPFCSYARMDMTELAFGKHFNAVIIPYNTLNLLTDVNSITACLSGVQAVLISGGTLLLQIFVPSQSLLTLDSKRSFQFQIFTTPEGHKVVKEILRTYVNATQTLHIEERYRIRPIDQKNCRSDFNNRMTLCARQADWWLNILKETGYIIDHLYGSYDFTPFLPGQSSCLLIAAHSD